MSVYDSRDHTFLPLKHYKSSLPALYSLEGLMLSIRCRFINNKILFLDPIKKNLIIYDVKKDEVITRHLPPSALKENITWASKWLTINDRTGIVYGGRTGIYITHFDPVTFQFTPDSIPLFNDIVCREVIFDSEGRLWFATNNGIYQQNIKQPALHSVPLPMLTAKDLRYPTTFMSFLRHKDFVYAGSYALSPMLALDAKTCLVRKTISFEKLSPLCNQIWQIIQYNKDTLWVGTEKGLLWYDTQSGNFDRVHLASAFDGEIQASAITLLYKDSRGLFWIQPGWGNGIIMFDNKRKIARKFIITDKNNFLPLHVVNFVAEDKEGNVWFAENGLIRWNRQKEQFDTLMTSYYGYNKENTKILSLRNDEEGNLIFCNDQNGVLIYDPRRNNYRQISVGSGLEENAVYHAVPISNHSIWVVSHNYISVIDRNESKSISYSYADSLPQKLFITSYHDSIGKRIFLGYENTIAWVSDTVVRKRDRPIAFYIDAVNIGDDTTIYFPPEKLSLGYEQNEITIHFSALNYYEPQSNRYTYRVNQKPWETIGNENVLRFSRLSPGNYEIEIKYYTASDLNAETIKKINIVIDPPFWRTWWFYSIILVLIATAGFLVYEKHINTVKQRAYIDKQMAEYEIKALHAQMNPHFIFNCLNSIREMILNNENRNASHYLSKFAQLIRITLQQSSRPFISLENTIDYLQRYMEMEKIRSSHFEYHIHLDKC
jgi:streptogramin lyase